jgi:hypothetical protein
MLPLSPLNKEYGMKVFQDSLLKVFQHSLLKAFQGSLLKAVEIQEGKSIGGLEKISH